MRSWSVIHAPDFEYITQLPPNPVTKEHGMLMLGGAFTRTKEQGLDQVGVWDDSTMDTSTVMSLNGCIPTVFEGGNTTMASCWSGIIAFTGDTMPFVGRIGDAVKKGKGEEETEPGQWVSAGYNGEGMVYAWLCATAVAIMILGMEDQVLEKSSGRPGGKLEDWFPVDELGFNGGRITRADLKHLAMEEA
jgi:glycine/D-amino acid oxidase-like deaminating enzyme